MVRHVVVASSRRSASQSRQHEHLDSPALNELGDLAPSSAAHSPNKDANSSSIVGYPNENESSSLLFIGSAARAEDRLDRLIMPESSYLDSKRHIRHFYASQNEFLGSLKKLVSLKEIDEEEHESLQRLLT